MGDYPSGVQLGGGTYAASNTLAAPRAAQNGSTFSVNPQQIPAIASGPKPDNATSTTVVPQTTLGATNSSVPVKSSSPLSGEIPPFDRFTAGVSQCHDGPLQAL